MLALRMLRDLVVAVMLVLLIAAGSCKHKTSKDFHGNDRMMVDNAVVIRGAIESYRADTSDFPEDIRQAERFLPLGITWPANPYNGKPIEDTRSAEFDPATSVGNIYYEVFTRDEQVVGCRVHVFGDQGKLTILDHTAFGAQ